MRYPFFILCFVILTISCASNFDVYIRATSDLNNGGNSVVIKIYQLRSDVNFKRISIENFWQAQPGELSRDIIGDVIEIVLYPEEKKNIFELKLKDETQYLGVAANFYNPNLDNWRYSYDLTAESKDELLIVVGRDRVTITDPND